MSRYVAREIRILFAAIDRLQVNEILSPNEAGAMCRLVCKRAARHGVGISSKTPAGVPLSNQIRVHWCSRDGRQINRLCPAFNAENLGAATAPDAAKENEK